MSTQYKTANIHAYKRILSHFQNNVPITHLEILHHEKFIMLLVLNGRVDEVDERAIIESCNQQDYINGSVEDCSNSSVSAMELLHSCTEP